MYAYRIAQSDSSYDWVITPYAPYLDADGFGWVHNVLFHEKKFTPEEFNSLCEQCIQENIHRLVEKKIKQAGIDFLVDREYPRMLTVWSDDILSLVYTDLISKHGFIRPEQTASFSVPRPTYVNMNPNEKLASSKSTTIMRKVKVWFHEALKVRAAKGKA